MPTNICLNMIVKNEVNVLERLFESLKNIIDYYIIVDTGSTDGTPEFIKEQMQKYGIPGEVHLEEWVNFGINRNQALQYVYKSGFQGWVLLIDADEEICCDSLEVFSSLVPGTTYQMEKHHNTLRYALPNLIDVSQNRWQWRGVVHEYLEHLEGTHQLENLPQAWIKYHSGEGARSQGVTTEEKFLRDAALLEKECELHPDDCRSRFYLAQSYYDAAHVQQAYKHYQDRARMHGWNEENFVARLRCGFIACELNKPYEEVVQHLLGAYKMRPSRAEPFHKLAVYHRELERYPEAYGYAKAASLIPFPDDRLFVDTAVYQWQILDELAVAAYWIGAHAESEQACQAIMQKQNEQLINLEEQTFQRIEQNLHFAVSKRAE